MNSWFEKDIENPDILGCHMAEKGFGFDDLKKAVQNRTGGSVFLNDDDEEEEIVLTINNIVIKSEKDMVQFEQIKNEIVQFMKQE